MRIQDIIVEGETVRGLLSPLYHGSQQPITKFKIPAYGVFFSPHRGWAEQYGPAITAVKVNAAKVYVLDHYNRQDDQILDALFDRDYVTLAKFVKLLQAQGYHAMQTQTDSEMVVVFPGTRIQVLESEPELDEGWRDWVAGAAMGAAALGGAQAAPKHHAPVAHVQPAPQIQKISPEQSRAGQSPEELKAYVEAMAQKYLPANQVAQFVGQVAHETANFTSMIEQNPEKNLKHYAKAKNPLGNKGMEDAVKYIGRGFLQITGKYNYKHFGDKIRPGLGDELLKNPNLAMRKDVAMALAIMFWRERVAPKMEKGASHKEIATAINGRKPKGLDSRAQAVKVAAATIPTKRRS